MEVGVSELPPPGSDFEEEEEQHEEEAGEDVQDHTQTHVHAVKTQTQTQDPHSSPCSSSSTVPGQCPPLVSRARLWPLLSFLLWLHPLSSSYSSSSVLRLRPAGMHRVWRWCRDLWGGQGVFRGQVGDSIVMSEEAKDIVLVPDMDAVFLLVAGGAEGGAGPWSFRKEGVITQGACQPVVDHVVLVPQPQHLLLPTLDSVHTGGRCLLKVSATLLTAEEGPDVATHHLQHRSRLGLQTCVFQCSGCGIMLDCQNVEQSPEGTWVTSEPWPAALATNPAKLRPQEHT